MLDFFKQYSVTIFGILLSAFLSTLFFFKNKKKKLLAYEVEFAKPVVEKLNHDIKIYYKNNTEITDTLTMVSVKFINSGNEPIKRDDFEKDIILKFNNENNTKLPMVYEINVNKTKPVDLDIEVFNEDFGKNTGFKPLLLNPKDEFTINLLMTNFQNLAISGRLVGGNVDIYKRSQKELFNNLNPHFVLVLLMVVTFFTGFIDMTNLGQSILDYFK
ncbi:hypothetical protein [Peribacillus sp. NPDC058075]|uniref:hypothetical protein n=1 Tax=unclassified Peribacillus TaxID=2675266 RepID=UPI0036DB64B7